MLVAQVGLATGIQQGQLRLAFVVPPVVGMVHDGLCNLPVALLQCPCIDEAVPL
jgi:hypothetical protein